MSNWTKELDSLKTILVQPLEVPEVQMKWLKGACKKAKEKGEKANDTLVGHIKEEYHIKSFPKKFLEFLVQCTSSAAISKHLAKIRYLSEDRPLYLHSLWVNYMKKHEFNPPHDHTGVLSFIIFVKIPYDLKEEEKQFSIKKEENYNHTSKLGFLNTLSDGSIKLKGINVDKSYEGKMLMFPSAQMHEVFPFYTSNNYRITVSGNIRIQV